MYNFHTRSAFPLALLALLVVLPCCADDMDNPGGASATIGAASSSTGDEPASTGDVNDPTDGTTGEDPSTGTTEDPFPASPPMCARFVQVDLGAPDGARHLTIDSSSCARASVLDMTLAINKGPVLAVPLGYAGSCRAYGEASSWALQDDVQGVEVQLATGVEEIPAYILTLYVDGETSDMLRVPAILKSAAWHATPPTPIRLTAIDEWWVVVEAPVVGCMLAAPNP